MVKRLLIDAAHKEETRIVVANDSVVEEFDYQSANKKTTKGNIYLAKVTRVEPSLQAAFVDYGSERHGFLPFAEIHPDYYQIPVADRQQLIEEMRQEFEQFSDDDNQEQPVNSSAYNRYNIQEVIKRDQVILVQVEKEERGNKGASLTTYISLAGRYCVLMPNATKGGGVSRKIDDFEDKKRLKKVAIELTEDLKGNGSVIIRTAGAFKTKTEIKKDLQYLTKLWDNVVKYTIESNAPAFIHEEGDIIIKSIRDLYDADVSDLYVAGEAAYEKAKEFMKAILPRHVNKVKLHRESEPLFSKFGVEEKLSMLHSPVVELPSGGYLVINHTEALVAIDVNSGKATSERNVEGTAYRTNIEAADEIALQVRLRDLSGLIVVDFIDMLELKNRKAVERALCEAVESDKAKVHIGRISQFGLLEISRQRLKPSFVEVNTGVCSHCNGRGRLRPVESTAIAILRAIDSELAQGNCGELLVSGSKELMFYILNQKRQEILEIEQKTQVKINCYIDDTAGGDGFYIEKTKVQRQQKEQKNEPLSGVDQSFADIEQEPAHHPKERNSDVNRGKKFKFKGKKSTPVTENTDEVDQEVDQEVENQQDIANIQSEFADESQEASEQNFKNQRKHKSIARDRHKKPFNKRPREFKNKNLHDMKDQHSKFHDNKGLPVIDDEELQNFDEEMAKRRKQNQGLLKEIWKKIVD